MTRPPEYGRRVFTDTSAYYAVANESDTNHPAARTILQRLVAQRRRQFTTNFVVAESHALILVRLGYRQAIRFLESIERTPTTTAVRVSARDERRAREIIARYDDKRFTYTDATSFAVMERLHIAVAFAFDRNFEQYGFTVLTPEQLSQ